jgi:Uncharacterized protein conserved in bacteria
MERLDQKIKSLELLAEKRVMQIEQEKAMLDVLPLRFKNNIAAFRKFIPSISCRFESYQATRKFDFFCTDNGAPNIRWFDDGSYFYGSEPFSECLSQIEYALNHCKIVRPTMSVSVDRFQEVHTQYINQLITHCESEFSTQIEEHVQESIPLAFMFGVGLGYQIGYLYERCQVANLFIFEPDEDLFFASLFAFDWAPLLDYLHENNMGIHFFVGGHEQDIVEQVQGVLLQRSPFIAISSFGFQHYDSNVLRNMKEKIESELHSMGMGFGFFDDALFALSHSVDNIHAQVPFFSKGVNLPVAWESVPVFIIANGPSLDESIDYLKENKERALLVACGTAISALHKAGVKPDIYVAVERLDVVATSLNSLNDKEYLQDIILIGSDVLHPQLRELFAKRIYAFKDNEAMYALLSTHFTNIKEYKSFSLINPLVGNFGVSAMLHIGFKNLYFFGLDNGFKSAEHHHSKFSFYYNSANLGKGNIALADESLCFNGNFGGVFKSNWLFHESVKMIEKVIALFPDAQCHNCSDGVAIDGVPALLREQVKLADMDKTAIATYLLHDMSRPIDIDVEKLDTCLDVELFNRVLNKFLFDIDSLPNSRLAVIQLMQSHMEILGQISRTPKKHISRVLIGSINAVYAIMTYLLYGFKSEENAMASLHDVMPVVVDLMQEMSRLYSHAFDFVQGTHQQHHKCESHRRD